MRKKQSKMQNRKRLFPPGAHLRAFVCEFHAVLTDFTFLGKRKQKAHASHSQTSRKVNFSYCLPFACHSQQKRFPRGAHSRIHSFVCAYTAAGIFFTRRKGQKAKNISHCQWSRARREEKNCAACCDSPRVLSLAVCRERSSAQEGIFCIFWREWMKFVSAPLIKLEHN